MERWENRKIQENGNSLAILIPSVIVDKHKLKLSDKIVVGYNAVTGVMSIDFTGKVSNRLKYFDRSVLKSGARSLYVSIPSLITQLNDLKAGQTLSIQYENSVMSINFEEVQNEKNCDLSESSTP